VRRLIVVLALAACAQPAVPPGGPEIKTPPKLLAVEPESGAVNVHPNEVSLTFDHVLSERPAASGASELSDLVLISPRDGRVRVGWHRDRITIEPRDGWRRNTAYVVTILPGLADLRGNVRKDPTVIVFSTGPTIPSTRLTGTLFDWPAGRALGTGMVEALSRPDTTLVYVAHTDSTGTFTLRHLPPGTYTLRGYNDVNNNRMLDAREAWDSVHVVLRDTARAELLAFVHDTIGPHIQQVSLLDSVTVRVTFDRPLAPAQRLDTTVFAMQRADSSAFPIARLVPGPQWDSARAESARVADSTRPGRDTTRAPRPAPRARTGTDTTARTAPPLLKPSRPIPPSDVVLVLGAPLAPNATYRVTARQVQNLLGIRATSSRTFTVPRSGAPVGSPPPAARPDTARRARDTTHVR
jgi:hypothetical protein